MKYLVTGGAGLIGSAISDKLLSDGHEVLILDNLSTGDIKNINSKSIFYKCDLDKDSQENINTYFNDIDCVFHCAALPNVQYSIDYPIEANNVNVNSTIKVLIACVNNNIKKIIYSSSCSVYGNSLTVPTTETCDILPLSPYALQKYIGEQYIELYNRMYGLSYVILRYFNVYGERMSDKGAYVSVLSHFIKAYKNNNPLNITNDGEQKRDFVYVEDVANANIAAISDCINNQVFNIGSGTNYSVNTLASVFQRPIKYGDKRIEPYETLADINKAKNILNWNPQTNVIDWIKNFIKE